MVEEPTVEETIEILFGIRERYEDHHQVKITDEAINAAADLSVRYVADRSLPDKAIDLIDEAASRVRLRHARRRRRPARGAAGARGDDAREGRRDRRAGLRGGVAAARRGGAAQGADRGAPRRVAGQVAGDLPVVDEEEIAQVVACGPGSRSPASPEESERLLHMEDTSTSA